MLKATDQLDPLEVAQQPQDEQVPELLARSGADKISMEITGKSLESN